MCSNIYKLLFWLTLCVLLAGCNRDKIKPLLTEPVSAKKDPVNDLSLWNAEGVYGTFYSPDGKWISAGCGNGQIKIYNRYTLQLHCSLHFNDGPAHSALFSADSKLLISSSYDSLVAIYDILNCKLVKYNRSIKKGTYTAIFSNSGNYYAVCGEDSTAKIFTYKNDSLAYDLIHPKPVHFIWYSNDDHYFATACDDGIGRIYDMKQGGKLITQLHSGAALYCIVIDNKNNKVVTVGNDNMVKLWDLKSGQLIRTMQGHQSATFVALFSPDDRLIGSCSADGTVKLWDETNGNLIRTYKGHKGVLSSLHFSPDGQQLLSGSMDGTIKIWDVKSDSCIATVKVAD